METQRLPPPLKLPPLMDFPPAPALQPLPGTEGADADFPTAPLTPQLDPWLEDERARHRLERKDAQDAARYMTTPGDGGPRALRWEEARVAFVPVGSTVRGVVEEVRPYGAFIGLVLSTSSRPRQATGEDSRVRGFCEAAEMGSAQAGPAVGEQVAVRIMSVDRSSQRIHVSIMQAEPQWPFRTVLTPRTADSRPSDEEAAALVDSL